MLGTFFVIDWNKSFIHRDNTIWKNQFSYQQKPCFFLKIHSYDLMVFDVFFVGSPASIAISNDIPTVLSEDISNQMPESTNTTNNTTTTSKEWVYYDDDEAFLDDDIEPDMNSDGDSDFGESYGSRKKKKTKGGRGGRGNRR